MSNQTRIVRNLHLALAAMLAIGMAGSGYAADASTAPVPAVPAAQRPVQELDQLDEIWVRGKHLSRVIEDAEDDFFKRYNKLNKDSDYDVFCGVMALNRGSMLMVRKCLPGFIVYNNYNVRMNTVSFGSGCFGGYGQPGYGQPYSDTAYSFSCGSGWGYGNSGYIPPSMGLPGPSLLERRPAYSKNVYKIVSGDPQLLEMARSLGGLYDEMDLAQQHYVRVKQASMPQQPGRKPARFRGPRAL